MIEFHSEESNKYLLVQKDYDGLYSHEYVSSTKRTKMSPYMPFEELPPEIQERVAILLLAPYDVHVSNVGERISEYFYLAN